MLIAPTIVIQDRGMRRREREAASKPRGSNTAFVNFLHVAQADVSETVPCFVRGVGGGAVGPDGRERAGVAAHEGTIVCQYHLNPWSQ